MLEEDDERPKARQVWTTTVPARCLYSHRKFEDHMKLANGRRVLAKQERSVYLLKQENRVNLKATGQMVSRWENSFSVK